MGLHISNELEHYWRYEPDDGPIHLPRRYITLLRWEQIKRYLHISDPREQDSLHQLPKSVQQLHKKEWWYKLEPLASTFHKASQQYYTPSSNVAIDELMVKCSGRSSHTVKMPKKPIKQGYKIFALADHDYIWTFSWSSRQLGIADMFKYPGLTPTGSMILNMVKRLSKISGIYSIYLDNYFISVQLFQLLREHGYGACGTT